MDHTTLESLRAEIDALKSEVTSLKSEHRAAARGSRRRLMASALAAVLAIAWASTPEARAQFGLTLAGLNARLTAVEARTAPISVVGTNFTISGKNVHVVDGSGSTFSNTGLGNLTVGYNELRMDGTDARTGSHNLIVGDTNNYTNSAGLVAGSTNEISGQYATVCGGGGNTAGGDYSTVGGGVNNSASGKAGSVGGGEHNAASGYAASVGGGKSNTAGGTDQFLP